MKPKAHHCIGTGRPAMTTSGRAVCQHCGRIVQVELVRIGGSSPRPVLAAHSPTAPARMARMSALAPLHRFPIIDARTIGGGDPGLFAHVEHGRRDRSGRSVGSPTATGTTPWPVRRRDLYDLGVVVALGAVCGAIVGWGAR